MEENKKIALVGNPNCGKSTLFNLMTGSNEYVGNRPGVTVKAKEALLKNHSNITIADTPGVYSLSAFSPDEKATENYLLYEKPDVIINLADSRNLRRSLYLTTQILELGIPTILVLNNFKRSGFVSEKDLSAALGIEVINICAKNKIDVSACAEKAVSLIGTKQKKLRFEKDGKTQAELISKRYGFVDEIISFCAIETEGQRKLTEKTDKIVLNRFLAFPIFFGLVFLVYYLSIFVIGSSVSDFFEKIFSENLSVFLIDLLTKANCPPSVLSLFENAVLSAVFTVLGFLPQIFMLFFSLTLLEESGYMSRAAFLTDAVFKNSALSGKSLISFLVGSTCSVTGMMSARTIESKKSRNLTVMLTPFIPCSAKVTVIALVAQKNFESKNLTLVFAFLLSVFAVIFSAKLLKNHKFFKEDSSFLIELPAYSLPSVAEAVKKALKQSGGFVKKAFSSIFLSAVFLWALSFFGFINGEISEAASFDKSFLGLFGNFISPLFTPLGFGNAQCASAVISGLFAKENVIGTLSMFSSSLPPITTADALSFLAFNLFCPPCIIAVGTMKKELGSLKLTAFALFYQTVFAYLLSFVIHFLIGLLF